MSLGGRAVDSILCFLRTPRPSFRDFLWTTAPPTMFGPLTNLLNLLSGRFSWLIFTNFVESKIEIFGSLPQSTFITFAAAFYKISEKFSNPARSAQF